MAYKTRRINVSMRSFPKPKTPKIKVKKSKPTTKESFLKLMKDVSAVIAGKKPRTTTAKRRLYNAFWSAITLSLFTDIHHAYKVKSLGLIDSLGKDWPDLSIETKAYKRPKKGLLTGNQRRKYKANTPGLLSPSQYTAWKKQFFKVAQAEERAYRRLGIPISRTEIREKAARSAWNFAKMRGAETLKEVLGTKDMLIMRVTDRLYESLTPGHITNLQYVKGNSDQVARLAKGTLTLGTKVPYADLAARKVKKDGKTMDREFLPKDLGVWYDRALGKARDALSKEIEKLAKERKLLPVKKKK